MAEFTAITTQEQLDAVVGERLKQEIGTIEKKYEGYLSPEEVAEKYSGYLSPEEVAKKDREINGYKVASMKMKVAHEIGLPYELSARLSGEDEDTIRKDAENLFKIVGKRGTGGLPPLADREAGADDKDAALRQMVRDLNKKGE